MSNWDEQWEQGTLLQQNPPPRASTSTNNRPSTSARPTTAASNRRALIDDGDDVAMAAPTDPAVDRAIQPIQSDETNLDKLMRHWMNERHSPEIQESQEVILSSLLDHIRRQSDAVQLLRGELSTSEEEHLRITLVQTEVERVKFVVRSYVRTRLYKIEKYARYIIEHPEIQTRLTSSEMDHARRFSTLTDQHFNNSILQSLPETQRMLHSQPIFMPNMVSEPNYERPVFVHALVDCPEIRFQDETKLTMKKGHISLMPYSAVATLLARGQVELV